MINAYAMLINNNFTSDMPEGIIGTAYECKVSDKERYTSCSSLFLSLLNFREREKSCIRQGDQKMSVR